MHCSHAVLGGPLGGGGTIVTYVLVDHVNVEKWLFIVSRARVLFQSPNKEENNKNKNI